MGDSTIQIKNTPVLIESLIELKPTQISAGGHHSAVVMKSGEVYTWGLGSHGGLGLGDTRS
jgi:alpha-tubulin suppressor-like RCC1 family protein